MSRKSALRTWTRESVTQKKIWKKAGAFTDVQYAAEYDRNMLAYASIILSSSYFSLSSTPVQCRSALSRNAMQVGGFRTWKENVLLAREQTNQSSDSKRSNAQDFVDRNEELHHCCVHCCTAAWRSDCPQTCFQNGARENFDAVPDWHTKTRANSSSHGRVRCGQRKSQTS